MHSSPHTLLLSMGKHDDTDTDVRPADKDTANDTTTPTATTTTGAVATSTKNVPTSMFKTELAAVKQLVDGIPTLFPRINVNMTEEGIVIQDIDNSGAIILKAEILKSDMIVYKHKGAPIPLGWVLKEFSKVFKTTDADTLQVEYFRSGEKQILTLDGPVAEDEVEMSLADVDGHDDLEDEEIEGDTSFVVDGAAIRSYVQEGTGIGDLFIIDVREDGPRFRFDPNQNFNTIKSYSRRYKKNVVHGASASSQPPDNTESGDIALQPMGATGINPINVRGKPGTAVHLTRQMAVILKPVPKNEPVTFAINHDDANPEERFTQVRYRLGPMRVCFTIGMVFRPDVDDGNEGKTQTSDNHDSDSDGGGLEGGEDDKSTKKPATGKKKTVPAVVPPPKPESDSSSSSSSAHESQEEEEEGEGEGPPAKKKKKKVSADDGQKKKKKKDRSSGDATKSSDDVKKKKKDSSDAKKKTKDGGGDDVSKKRKSADDAHAALKKKKIADSDSDSE
jgi:hypothetical protein